jgi:hypothetical protein
MNYKGFVAAIIAGTIGATLLIAVISLGWHNKEFTDRGARIFIAALSGLLVSLGYYMGRRNGKQ